MGLDFRGGNYKRYVRFGKRTIKQGEGSSPHTDCLLFKSSEYVSSNNLSLSALSTAAAVWNMSGVQTEIVGPKLVRLFYSNIRFLDRYSAKSEQYLVVSYIGEIEKIYIEDVSELSIS